MTRFRLRREVRHAWQTAAARVAVCAVTGLTPSRLQTARRQRRGAEAERRTAKELADGSGVPVVFGTDP